MSEPFFEVASIDYPIIDSDAHVNEPPELWQERVPSRLRVRAPKVLHTPEGDVWSFDDGKKLRPLGLTATAGLSYLQFKASGMRYDGIRPGSFNTAERLKDLDADGLYAQILYPSVTLAGARTYTDDRELQCACVRAYNEWLREFCAPSGGRLIPQAIIPTTGIDDAVAELRWAIEHDHKGALIATFPNGSYEPAPEDDRFWAIAQEADYPLGIHIGSFSEAGLQATISQGTLSFLAHAGGSKSGADSIPATTKVLFSGACEKFPRLRFVIVEGNIGWIPTVMEQVDDMFLRYRWYTKASEVMTTMPSRLFHRNFWATFMIDTIGIELRHHMNVGHLMWSTDYPHTGTDWPNNRVTIARLFRGVPKDEVRKMLHDNCKALYHLDHIPASLPGAEPVLTLASRILMSAPLAGVRVLDLSSDIAGPYCTKLLVDAGADVLKIEPPDGGDRLRRWTASGQPLADDEDGVLFRFLNTSKRSAAIDYTSDAGREQVLTLAATADLVVESFAPGWIEALGLAPAVLWERNPTISMVSISPFGRGGPWSQRPATEFTLQAWCGSTAARGTPERPPIAAGGRLGEWLGGAYAAVAALTAYHATRRSGRGAHIDLALLEVMALTMAPNSMVWESLAGQPSLFTRTVEIPSIEPARDGWVGFCTITAQQWRDFLVLIERPDLVEDESLARWDERVRRVGEVNAMIHAWTGRHDVRDIVERAAALRIPVAAIGTGDTIVRSEHFAARGAFVSHPGASFVQPRPPYRLSDASLAPLTPAPKRGEHAAAWLASPGHRVEIASLRPAEEPGSPPAQTNGRPLSGLRIIDFTAFWAGPFATHYLAAMGADVIKVESIQRPDGMRFQSVRPPTSDRWWEWSALYQTVNLGKRAITLDLSRPAGVDLITRLLAGADAAVENFSPRVMDNLGLGYDRLAASNPRLIMVRMPAFGLDGPWRDRVGFAQTMEQATGMAWLTGFVDGPPVLPRGPCDPLAGLHALVALLVALEHRRHTGRGQLVEATMVEAALNAAAEIVLEHGAYGVRLMRDGNRGPVGTPQNLYACRGTDRWLALAVTSDEQWRALSSAMGDPTWSRDAALGTATGRRAQHDRVDRGIAAWCAERDADEAAEALIGLGIPAAPVVAAARLDENPHLQARGFFETVGHPVVGTHRQPALPLQLTAQRTPWYTRPAPTLGEHTDEVLRELLGLDDDALARLRADGIIGERPMGL